MSSVISSQYLAQIHEDMEDLDYSRFTWGHEVTQDVITAAAVVAMREGPGYPTVDDVLKVMGRGWVSYSGWDELRASDERGDELNTLLMEFNFPSEEREKADERIGRALIVKANESKEMAVTFEDDDIPGRWQLDEIVIFQKER